MTVEVTEKLNEKKRRFNQAVGEARSVKSQVTNLEAEIGTLKQTVDDLRIVSEIIDQMTTDVQKEFLGTIEKIISDGLSSVFETRIEFKISPKVRNKVVTLDFTLLNEDGTETDVVDSRGGGLISLAGVLMRLLMIRLMRPVVQQVAVLDEPLGQLSSGFQPAAMELLAKVAQDLDIQIIMVSHQMEAAEWADVVYELEAGPNGATAHVRQTDRLRPSEDSETH